ncbi:MAG: response regulator transcription factor [Hyphomicrobiales bacterium]|nr:response regulator transcription factor [Hyphomicrobiales bacterium]
MKILIADDHVLFREGLKLIIKHFDEAIELIEADTFEEAAQTADATPDLDMVLLDLKMPGVMGMEGLVDMRRRVGETPVVIVSGAYSRPDIAEAFRCGAAGFIPKTLGSRAMYSAINLILSGERYVPSLAFVDEDSDPGAAMAPAAEPAPAEDPFQALTPRERDVLVLLAQGMSNREIADKLHLQEVSIRARLTGIFKKLGVNSRTQAVGVAIRGGFPNSA